MTKTSVALSVLSLSLALAGCKKEVDSSYLAGIDSSADEVCRCAKFPKVERATKCSNRTEKGLHPEQGPGGEPAATYEAKLNDKSQGLLKTARDKAQACIDEIGKGEGGGGGGGGERPRRGDRERNGGQGGGGQGGGGQGGGANGGQGGNAPVPAGSY